MCGIRIRQRRRHVYTVFPFELGPHVAELHSEKNTQSASKVECGQRRTCLCFRTISGLDVIHDIDMDVAQNDSLLRKIRGFPKDATKNYTRLRRRDLNSRLDILEAVWPDSVDCWPFNNL